MYEFVYMYMYTFDSKFQKHLKKNVLVEICGHNRVVFGRQMYLLAY